MVRNSAGSPTNAMSTLPKTRRKTTASHQRGEPTWELVRLFPRQGDWTEDEYLALKNSTNQLVELVDGCLEFLPMPDLSHQSIVRHLFRLLDAYLQSNPIGGLFFAPAPIRLWPGRFREPDLFLVSPRDISSLHEPPTGAMMVIEVVSPGKESRQRDLVAKRKDYARAGIREYWIVDPGERCITVLRLAGKTYRVHGKFRAGEQAASALLTGVVVDVRAVFAAGNPRKRPAQ